MDLGLLISDFPDGLAMLADAGTTGRAGVAVASAAGATRITDITEDSRSVMPGSLFIARKGEKSDGRVFIKAAVAAGAAAVLVEAGVLPAEAEAAIFEAGRRGTLVLTSTDVPLATALLAERFYGEPSAKLKLIGATGTNGKTTTTFLIHQLLNKVHIRCGLMGTVLIDDGVETAPAQLTTAPALEISRTLARMHESGCRACSFEVSSHALDQERVGALKIAAGVFSNLTHDHLDYHKTMENYAAAKARLFAMLPGAAAGGVAVVNADDPWHKRMLQDCKARVVRCSMKSRHDASLPAADWSARIVALTLTGMDVEFTPPTGRPVRVHLPLIGEFNVMNAMQAAAVASACYPDHLTAQAAAEALAHVHAPPGRLQPVTGPQDAAAVFVDYAHTDDALSRVLTVLRKALVGSGSGGRLLCVFGCGGDRDKAKRPKMARVAATLADKAFATSDNPRSENPDAILDQVVAGVPTERRSAVTRVTDRAKAIRQAVADLHAGDILVVAGKGHEDYQIVADGRGGTVKNKFDDRDEVRKALAAKRAGGRG